MCQCNIFICQFWPGRCRFLASLLVIYSSHSSHSSLSGFCAQLGNAIAQYEYHNFFWCAYICRLNWMMCQKCGCSSLLDNIWQLLIPSYECRMSTLSPIECIFSVSICNTHTQTRETSWQLSELLCEYTIMGTKNNNSKSKKGLVGVMKTWQKRSQCILFTRWKWKREKKCICFDYENTHHVFR